MPVIKRKPTTPTRRFATVLDFSELTKKPPEKRLMESLSRSGGRNNLGRETSRHRGGRHKRAYRIIDFKRDKIDIPARVASLEYDPNRSANIALLNYSDGEKRYILAPEGLKVNDRIFSGRKLDILPGNAMPLADMPLGTTVHNIELRPGRGAQIARGAGVGVSIIAKEGQYVLLRMPSGEMRKFAQDCRAVVGAVGNGDHEKVQLGKAGRNRWKGVRPQSRGVVMNPVDHPMGGGEGRSSGGRHPCSPEGIPAKGYKTRRGARPSDRLIVQRRKKKQG